MSQASTTWTSPCCAQDGGRKLRLGKFCYLLSGIRTDGLSRTSTARASPVTVALVFCCSSILVQYSRPKRQPLGQALLHVHWSANTQTAVSCWVRRHPECLVTQVNTAVLFPSVVDRSRVSTARAGSATTCFGPNRWHVHRVPSVNRLGQAPPRIRRLEYVPSVNRLGMLYE